MVFQEKVLNEKINWLISFSTQQTWFSWITLILLLNCWNRRAQSSLFPVVHFVGFIEKNVISWAAFLLESVSLILQRSLFFSQPFWKKASQWSFVTLWFLPLHNIMYSVKTAKICCVCNCMWLLQHMWEIVCVCAYVCTNVCVYLCAPLWVDCITDHSRPFLLAMVWKWREDAVLSRLDWKLQVGVGIEEHAFLQTNCLNVW